MAKQKKKVKVSETITFDEFNHENKIKCPYCLHNNHMDLEKAQEILELEGDEIDWKDGVDEEKDTNIECDKCGKTFIVTISIQFAEDGSWMFDSEEDYEEYLSDLDD